jgi:hypothetical protein
MLFALIYVFLRTSSCLFSRRIQSLLQEKI